MNADKQPLEFRHVEPRRSAVPWKVLFRVFRWSTYAAALLTLILLLHKGPPPDIQVTAQAAARVDEKFQEVAQAVANGQPASMHMDQTELNSYLASHLELPSSARLQYAAPTVAATSGGAASAAAAQPATQTVSAVPATALSGDDSGVPGLPSAAEIDQMRSNVKDVKVQLVGDRAIAYVIFGVHGADLTLQLEGKLASDNGYLRFEPLGGKIGSFPLPLSALQNAMQRLMESPENREKLRLPPDVSDLRIENGEVITTYK
ncbi:MAG TPA: hypothetical protein VE545_05775 [Candidatus Dormibacteraeota bacterium]|nr:hypothetical protein [Candidatus Dormibacteraeota bacterium]